MLDGSDLVIRYVAADVDDWMAFHDTQEWVLNALPGEGVDEYLERREDEALAEYEDWLDRGTWIPTRV